MHIMILVSTKNQKEQNSAINAGRVGAERRIETKQRRSLDFDTASPTQSALRSKYNFLGISKIRSSICLWLMIFHLCLSACAISYTLSVGHLPPSRNGNTFLLITDVSGLGPAVQISFHDDLGRNISTARKLLPCNGKIQIDVEDYLQTVGTIVLESSNEQIVGEYWQAHEGEAMFMLPLQSPSAEGRYFLNCFRFPPCSSDLLVLSDPYGSGPLVQMEFYSKAGELISIGRKMLRPYGTSAFDVNDYASWDVLGKVSIRSLFGGSIVLHSRRLCGNKGVLALSARSPASNLLIDEFSTGRGITSNLIITDASAEGPATEIQFLSDSGAMLSRLEKLLPRNGTVVIDPADYVGDVASGIIRINSEAKIIADYWEENPGTILNTPAIELDISAVDKAGSFLFISHFSPFDNTQNLLSLLNVGQGPVKVEIQFRDNNGTKLDDVKLTLNPYEQVDELMGHYFDGVHLGTIIVRGASANLVVTSHIFDLKNSRHLGTTRAQVVK